MRNALGRLVTVDGFDDDTLDGWADDLRLTRRDLRNGESLKRLVEKFLDHREALCRFGRGCGRPVHSSGRSAFACLCPTRPADGSEIHSAPARLKIWNP